MNRIPGLAAAVLLVGTILSGTAGAQLQQCPFGLQPNGELWTGPFDNLDDGPSWTAPDLENSVYYGYCVSASGETHVVYLDPPGETFEMTHPNGDDIDYVSFLKVAPPTTTSTSTTVPEETTTTTPEETTTTTAPTTSTTEPDSSTSTTSTVPESSTTSPEPDPDDECVGIVVDGVCSTAETGSPGFLDLLLVLGLVSAAIAVAAGGGMFLAKRLQR